LVSLQARLLKYSSDILRSSMRILKNKVKERRKEIIGLICCIRALFVLAAPFSEDQRKNNIFLSFVCLGGRGDSVRKMKKNLSL
jgi:hypothetical protein